jgi:hypothetical protein
MRTTVLALLLAASASADDDNLIAHGSFEKGVDGWRIDAPYAVTTRRAPGSKGFRSLLVKGAGSARTELAVPRGRSFLRVTAFVAAEDAVGGRLRFEMRDRNGRVLNQETDLFDLTHFTCRSELSGSFAWRRCERRFAVSPAAASAVFVLDEKSGRLWLDEVAVMPDDLTRTNLMSNGGFESGIAGWYAARASYALDKKTKAEGQQSLRAEKRGGHLAACYRMSDISFVPRGRRLKVSAKTRAERIDTAGVQILVYSRRGTVLAWRSLGGADLMPCANIKVGSWLRLAPILRKEGLCGTLDWKALALELEVPDGAHRAKVLLDWQDAGNGRGRVWLDDVSLRWSPRDARAAR